MGAAREYAKLARSFNLALTAVAAPLGAIAMGLYHLPTLAALLVLGAGAHIFGFVLNDYVDRPIDGATVELSDRPLLSGTISPRAALLFALVGLALMWAMALLLTAGWHWSLLVLGGATASATVYNLISKRAAGMDVFVAAAVLFLVLFGAALPTDGPADITLLGWVVVLLGFNQVLFMNIVAGGLKDIDHDSRAGGRTLAVALGCRVDGRGRLRIPRAFHGLAHGIEGVHITLVLLPLVILRDPLAPATASVLAAVTIACALMVRTSVRLLGQDRWDRDRLRSTIGRHYLLNYSCVPLMLALFQPWALSLLLVPPVGFIGSNLVLHGSAMAPKTM